MHADDFTQYDMTQYTALAFSKSAGLDPLILLEPYDGPPVRRNLSENFNPTGKHLSNEDPASPEFAEKGGATHGSK